MKKNAVYDNSATLWWLGLNAFLIVNLTLCALILFLLRPLWFDINKFIIAASGLDLNWAVIVLTTTVALVFYFSFAFTRHKQRALTPPFSLSYKVFCLLILVLWNAMFALLLTELKEEKRLLVSSFIETLPLIVTFIVAALLLFIVPKMKIFNNNAIKWVLCVFIVLAPILVSHSLNSFTLISGPYLQSPSQTSMTVMWLTSKDSKGYVEFGQGDVKQNKRQNASHGLVDVGRIHKVVLNGLQPATTYKYRIVAKEVTAFMPYNVNFGDIITSEEFSFTTADKNAKSVSFLVFNDVHENANTVADLLEAADAPEHDYVFYNGDIISHIDDENQIRNALIDPSVNSFAQSKPFTLVRGNHETRGAFARDLPRYISSPDDKYYSSFVAGGVYFLIMDSGEDKADDDVEYSGLVAFDDYRTEQTNWLKRQMETEEYKQAKFRVALMHMPIFGAPDQQDGVDDAAEKWGPLFNQGKLDILLAGHTHAYDVVEPNEGIHNYPIIIGGGNNPGERTVMQVKAEGGLLQVLMIRDDGETVADYQLTSNNK